MANKNEINENQMSLFNIKDNIKEDLVNVNSQIEESIYSSNPIQEFLNAKENISIEISDQVKMTMEEFINSTPAEDRFVSISKIEAEADTVMVTLIPEDGSITLKTMKEIFPDFVTQPQKINEFEITDSMDNIALIEKLEKIIEGKKIASIKEKASIKDIDSEINRDISGIGDLNSINIDEDCYDDKVEVEADLKNKPKKNKLKI